MFLAKVLCGNEDDGLVFRLVFRADRTDQPGRVLLNKAFIMRLDIIDSPVTALSRCQIKQPKLYTGGNCFAFGHREVNQVWFFLPSLGLFLRKGSLRNVKCLLIKIQVEAVGQVLFEFRGDIINGSILPIANTGLPILGFSGFGAVANHDPFTEAVNVAVDVVLAKFIFSFDYGVQQAQCTFIHNATIMLLNDQ